MRLQAAEWFAEGVEPPEVARRLRVSCNSAYVWRRRWRQEARLPWPPEVLAGRCAASGAQLERLRPRWRPARRSGMSEDQRWTLARVTTLMAAVPCPVHAARHVVPAAPPRYTPQVPVHRLRSGTRRRSPRGGGDLGEGTRLAAETGAYVCFEDEAGQNLRPPKARTWARRGTPPWSGLRKARGVCRLCA